MSKPAKPLFVLAIVLLFALMGCTPTGGSGPRTWIDFPLHNSSLPIMPISLTAHAAHEEGVARIVFSVDGDEAAAVDVGGDRLEDAAFEWAPPGPGEYTIEAYGIAVDGSTGAKAVSVVRVGTQTLSLTLSPSFTQPSPTIETLTPTVWTITPTVSITPSPTIPSVTPETPQPPDEPQATANQNGNCREGPSTEYEKKSYLLIGEQAIIEGRLADNSWYVITPPGESENCWIADSVVDVTGDLGGVKVVEAPPPPADNTPPTITANYVDPTGIVTRTCDDSGVGDRTSTSTITAEDESGIAEVRADWVLNDFHSGAILGSGTETFASSDGQTFQATFGNVGYIGTINITGVVVDNAGNESSFNQAIQVTCP